MILLYCIRCVFDSFGVLFVPEYVRVPSFGNIIELYRRVATQGEGDPCNVQIPSSSVLAV